MSRNSPLSSPPVLREIFKPRTGLAVQGGGKFCIFEEPVINRIFETTEIADSIVAATGVSGGAVKLAIAKDALAKEHPHLICEHGNKLWDAICATPQTSLAQYQLEIMQGNPFAHMNAALRGMSSLQGAAIDFTRAVTHELSPDASQLFMLKRQLESFGICDRTLGSSEGFQLYTSATRKDENGEWENVPYADPTLDQIIQSCALREFGGYQGHYDGAYMFNPYLEQMIDEHDLTDIIFVTTNPYDPRLPVLPQSALQDHEWSHDSGLKFCEIHSEAEHIRNKRGIKTHGFHLKWQPGWMVNDKIHASPAMMQNIREQGEIEADYKTPLIVGNLGQKSTYDPWPALDPSLAPPEAA